MTEFPGPRAFCDTSFFFASLCPRDVNYERAGEILKDAFCLSFDEDFARLGLNVIN